MEGENSSIKAIMYAFMANFGIAIAKGAAAIITGSGSMVAESIHSLADCANQLLLFLGLKRCRMPACEDHPLGYGKVIYFWSFIVAMLLFSMGGLFSIYEGIHKLNNPEPLTSSWIAITVLIFSIILEGLSLAGALREIKKIRGGASLSAWLKSSRNAELLVIFGEDVGALSGLTAALVFVTLTVITGNPMYDSIGSICIGVILIAISIFLILRIKSLIIGRSASPELQEHLREELAKTKDVTRIFNVITMQYGPDVVLAAKIKMDRTLNIDAACKIINGLEKNIKKKFPEVKWTFIEPDIED